MVELRQITDIPTLMSWRREVLENVFSLLPSEDLLDANRRYFERHIADGSHLAIVASAAGNDVGCGAICISEELPSPDNPSGRCAYLMNIYVRRPFRNQGIAHRVISRLVDEAKRLGCDKIYLETTSEGEKVYLTSGFRPMPDMMKYSLKS